MKLDLNTINNIVELSQSGYSSRAIAEVVGVCKSTVNNCLNKVKTVVDDTPANYKEESSEGPRILLYDLETAPALSYNFGRWKQNISQDGIAQEGGWIICAAYKWLGEESSTLIVGDIEDQSDKSLVQQLWSLYKNADAVVCHNALGFDHKVLQTRCIVNELPPLPYVKVLDTLQMAKKNFKFPSNKLDSIADILKIGRKKQTGGIKLWIDTMQGDEQALDKMLQYCQQDTELLESIYLKLRSWGTASNFNSAHYHSDEEERCPVCGSTDILDTKRTVFTDVSEFTEKVCYTCGSRHRTRKPLNSKEKRGSLLTSIKI